MKPLKSKKTIKANRKKKDIENSYYEKNSLPATTGVYTIYIIYIRLCI